MQVLNDFCFPILGNQELQMLFYLLIKSSCRELAFCYATSHSVETLAKSILELSLTNNYASCPLELSHKKVTIMCLNTSFPTAVQWTPGFYLK